jgi:hypothetical protein
LLDSAGLLAAGLLAAPPQMLRSGSSRSNPYDSRQPTSRDEPAHVGYARSISLAPPARGSREQSRSPAGSSSPLRVSPPPRARALINADVLILAARTSRDRAARLARADSGNGGGQPQPQPQPLAAEKTSGGTTTAAVSVLRVAADAADARSRVGHHGAALQAGAGAGAGPAPAPGAMHASSSPAMEAVPQQPEPESPSASQPLRRPWWRGGLRDGLMRGLLCVRRSPPSVPPSLPHSPPDAHARVPSQGGGQATVLLHLGGVPPKGNWR